MTTNSTRRPVDLEARTRAATDLVTSIALSAGAGSGKTSVLTERIVALLESGQVAPRALAAVTFTEKAAGEILARVRDTLERRLRDATDTDKRRTLEDVLARFGDLTLTTIHSFCRQLLLLESLEADFAPDTEVGDEAASRALFEAALRVFLDELRADNPALWRMVERLVTPRALREACQELDRYRELTDIASAEPFSFEAALAALEEIAREIEDAAAACTKPEDALLMRVAPLRAALNACVARRDAEGAWDLLLDDDELKLGGKGTIPNWGGKRGGKENKERMVQAVQRVLAWREHFRARAHGEILRALRNKLLPAYDRARTQAGVASFDDLLAGAARLLRTSAEARARLAQRFTVLLIDEVQDTDPVQAEIAALLSRALEDSGDWRESTVLTGRLFVVGDPKQSIYRFRGADVETFGRIEALVAKNGTKEALAQNFRSVPGVVDWVNHTFAELPGFSAQVAHREPLALDPVVLVQASDEVGETEAAVRYLRTLLESAAQVLDRDTKALRPVEPRDVMFLLPAWSKADGIADRLRQSGIDSVVEGGDTFFSRDEVRLGMAALRCIVEPADTEAAVFVLRGVFGHSHEELARHVAAGGSFRSTVPPAVAGAPSRVSESLSFLLKLHRGRGAKGLAALLDELWAESRALAVWRLLPDGPSRLANLDKLAAMVRAAEQKTRSPLGALEELLRVERDVADTDISRLDADAQAVRVTTLFKAKGLEAPVVFVLHASRSLKSPSVIVDHARRTCALALGALVPLGWKEHLEREREHLRQERRRWMYVAATRARDQLVIVRPAARYEKAKGDEVPQREVVAGDLLAADIDRRGLVDPESLAHDALVEVGPGARVRTLHAEDLADASPGAFTFPHHDDAVDALLADPPATGDPEGAARAAHLRDALRASTRACVRWRQASGEPGETGWKPGAQADAPPTERGVGARGGRVIHAVMERLDLAQPHDVCAQQADELVQLLAVQAALDEKTTFDCQDIVRRILKNPLVEQARKSPLVWREVPFTYSPRAGTVVSGTIDLVFARDLDKKEWVVFDWKSRVPAVGDKLRARYEQQLVKYAEALVHTMEGAKVVQTEIVGPFSELGETDGADAALADVSGRVRADLEALLARGAPMPLVGADVGEPAVTAELAWPELKLAVLVDPLDDDERALVAQGWTVRAAVDDEVARALGVAASAGENA